MKKEKRIALYKKVWCKIRYWQSLRDILMILLFFIGLGLVLYPSVSNYINQKHASRVVADYSNITKDKTNEEIQAEFDKADDYNRRLAATPMSFYDPSLVEGYNETLDPLGIGTMGYIYIDKIKVELPIYHGTSEGVLQIGAGHIEGTSLPVGGKGTHCVLSGHRGLPSAKLFTDLDEMEVGDFFRITVYDKVLTYRVDQIKVIEPTETDDLQIEDDKDYCTLLTCTPYGINTHRLLVRGLRFETEDTKPGIFVKNEAFLIDSYITMPIFSAPILFIILLFILAQRRKRLRMKEKALDAKLNEAIAAENKAVVEKPKPKKDNTSVKKKKRRKKMAVSEQRKNYKNSGK